MTTGVSPLSTFRRNLCCHYPRVYLPMGQVVQPVHPIKAQVEWNHYGRPCDLQIHGQGSHAHLPKTAIFEHGGNTSDLSPTVQQVPRKQFVRDDWPNTNTRFTPLFASLPQPASHSSTPAYIVTPWLGTTTVFLATPPTPSICPPTTDPLNAMITQLHDHSDLLMAQYRMQMIQQNDGTDKCTDLNRPTAIVELLPTFLASHSQQANVLLPPQLHHSLPHPESNQCQMPPWTTAKNSLCLMPKQAANKAVNLVLNINQIHYQKHINYQTTDLFCLPLKHVHFKNSALGNQGPTMFWPKEDMQPP